MIKCILQLSFIITINSSIVKLPLKRNYFKAITAIFQIDEINVELESSYYEKFTTLYCQDVKSSYNFCEKYNNNYLPCDEYCKKCLYNTCLGNQNEETGEYAKFVYQEIILDGIKVLDRIQVFQYSISNQTNGYFSIDRNSYLISQLVEIHKFDHILSFKYCIDDLQLIIGQDISQSQQKLEMIYDEQFDITFTNILGVVKHFLLSQQWILILLAQELADQIFQLMFRQNAGIRITPCIENYNQLVNISILFENNQTILLQPNEYYFKDNEKYCIPMTGNQYFTVLGFPVFHNRTLVTNYKDNYFKIDQTLCPKKQELFQVHETHTNWFSFHFILIYIFITLIGIQFTRILILRYKRRLQIASLSTSEYTQQ